MNHIYPTWITWIQHKSYGNPTWIPFKSHLSHIWTMFIPLFLLMFSLFLLVLFTTLTSMAVPCWARPFAKAAGWRDPRAIHLGAASASDRRNQRRKRDASNWHRNHVYIIHTCKVLYLYSCTDIYIYTYIYIHIILYIYIYIYIYVYAQSKKNSI